jgi:diguanylate cyclase (GGDEF)-like protein/PAS domain S-box-containing protein
LNPDVAAAEQRFETLLDALGVGVVVLSVDGHVQAANVRARQLLNLPPAWADDEGIVAENVEFLDEDGRLLPAHDVPAARTLETGEPFANVVLGARAKGDGVDVTWLLCGSHQLCDEDTGDATGVICTYVDITQQRATQDAMRASMERFLLFAENAADVIYRIALTPLRFEYINPAVQTILGYGREEFYRNPDFIFDLIHPDDLEMARSHITNEENSSQPLIIRMTRRDGEVISTEHRIVQVIEYGHVVALEGIVRDVTALKAAEADLSRLAFHDSLTGLPNRPHLLGRLDRALARPDRDVSVLAVLYIDADRFKVVNDNLGHDVGDRLLGVISQRTRDALRPSDFVARLGGDEFAAVLFDLHDEREAVQIAERICAAVAAPLDLGEGEMVTTVSIGIAYDGAERATSAELLRRADLAMYKAKDRGRARVEVYDGPVVAARTPLAG